MYHVKTNVPGDLRRLIAAERQRYVRVRNGVLVSASLRQVQEIVRDLEMNGLLPPRRGLPRAA